MRHLSASGCSAALMLAEPSDGELLSRWSATGEEVAFQAIIKRYERMVWSVCWRVLHHRQDAEDAFQQTILVAMRKAESIRNGESFQSWLHKVAWSVAKDIRNCRRRHESHERRCDLDKQLAQLGDELESRELLELLDAEVQRLPRKYRLPFMLHCLEGESRTETAAKLGLTKGMVASRVRKAREILQRNLAHGGIYPPGQQGRLGKWGSSE